MFRKLFLDHLVSYTGTYDLTDTDYNYTIETLHLSLYPLKQGLREDIFT